MGQKLGQSFVDTGEIHCVLTRPVLHRGVDLTDEDILTQLTAEAQIELASRDESDYNSVFVGGFDAVIEI